MNNEADLHEALNRVVLADRQLSDVLTEITRIARRAMPSVEAASITLIKGEEPFTAAYDGQMALDADELQYERGYGPCMDAGRAGQILLVDDMRTDQRWPDYAQQAAGKRSAWFAVCAAAFPRPDNRGLEHLRSAAARLRRQRC